MDLNSTWGLEKVVDFYKSSRDTPQDLYPTEQHFILPRLKEGMSILDIGCATGGFATAFKQQISDFEYTGLDVSSEMIKVAKEKNPEHQFHVIEEADFSPLKDKTFDLVICLGILHLHPAWRETAIQAWKHVKGSFIFDLREIASPTVEDINESSFKMDFNGGDETHKETILPYILLNTNDALNFVLSNFSEQAKEIQHLGQLKKPRTSSPMPTSQVMMNTWCIERS